MEKSSVPPGLLAISFYYPPANNPRAVQVARLFRRIALPTTIICAGYEDKSDRRDEALSAQAQESLHTLTRVPFLHGRFGRTAGGVVGLFARPFWDELPDDSRGWKGAVVDSATEYLHRAGSQKTVLVTFGSPMSDHLIGLELKKRCGLPWMAHFSDPWADNPFKKYGWFTKKANLALERSVIEAADRLLFTSAETVDLVMAKYRDSLKTKARIVPHSYEPSQYGTGTPSSKITIRYLGDMYGPRTPRPLFGALLSILKENKAALDEVCFEFVGSMCDLNIEAMGFRDLPPGLVILRETVSNQESLNLMTSADGLLVIDAPAAMSVFLPSKLIDYVGAGKPILGITPPGTASRLIGELGGWTGDPSDVSKVKEAVLGFIRFLRVRRGSVAPWGVESVRSRYEAQFVARDFSKAVSELV